MSISSIHKQKENKMKELLVVIDMVNGFINTGALADKNIDKITPNIERCIENAKEKHIPIIAFRDCHTENDKEFDVFPPHCIEGTIESELIPSLKKYENDMVLINKNTTNGFETKKFQLIAKNYNVDRVIVVGCCTDICVQAFVESFLEFNKNCNRKTQICVLENACYTFNGENHNAEIEHQKALIHMQHLGATIGHLKTKKDLELGQ